mmetsp:Transcript_58482/g.163914  ORF Transcript_58482/g.163914 Transcript_58482/m.163914 type:complete len:240 (-) Transcript_58482:430-1149(-)
MANDPHLRRRLLPRRCGPRSVHASSTRRSSHWSRTARCRRWATQLRIPFARIRPRPRSSADGRRRSRTSRRAIPVQTHRDTAARLATAWRTGTSARTSRARTTWPTTIAIAWRRRSCRPSRTSRASCASEASSPGGATSSPVLGRTIPGRTPRGRPDSLRWRLRSGHSRSRLRSTCLCRASGKDEAPARYSASASSCRAVSLGISSRSSAARMAPTLRADSGSCQARRRGSGFGRTPET